MVLGLRNPLPGLATEEPPWSQMQMPSEVQGLRKCLGGGLSAVEGGLSHPAQQEVMDI